MTKMAHDSTLTDQPQWQKLSPIAIAYFAAKGIKVVANNILYLIPALAFSYSSIAQNSQIWIPAILVLLSLITTFSVLSYIFYQYRLFNQQVEIRSGILFKKYVNLPFSKIQNVTLEQPFYYRLLDCCCVELDTAGSFKQEAKIVALPLSYAEIVKREILKYAQDTQNNNETEPSIDAIDSAEKVINTRSINDLIIHGITNNRVWIIVGAMAPFYETLLDKVVSVLESAGIDLKQLFDSQTHALWQMILLGISILVLVMFCMALISVAGSIAVFYRFTLSKLDDRYIRRSGLITLQEVSMRLSRLQLVVKKQDWLDLLLKRINLELRQNNSGVVHQNEMANSNKIVVPSVNSAQCEEIVNDALPTNQLASISFSPISKRFILRQIIVLIAPICLLCLGLFYLRQADTLLLCIVYSALASSLIYCRWRRWGFAIDDEFIYIRKGLFGVDYYCFPIYKVQQTEFMQSALMKARHLASVKMILASGPLTLPFVPENIAIQFIDRTLFKVESDQRSWM